MKRPREWILNGHFFNSTVNFKFRRKWKGVLVTAYMGSGQFCRIQITIFPFYKNLKRLWKAPNTLLFQELSLTITCFWGDRTISKQKWETVKSRYVDLTFTWACAVYVYGRSTAVQTNRFTGCFAVSRILHTLRVRSWQFSLYCVALKYYCVSIHCWSFRGHPTTVSSQIHRKHFLSYPEYF